MKAFVLVWLVPACFFAAGIFFYLLRRKGFQSQEWARAFILLGIGYSITTYQLASPSIVKSAIEDFFFLCGAAAMASALTKRLSGPPQWKTKAVIVASALLAAILTLHFSKSVRLETFWIQAGCVAMLCYSLVRSKKKKDLNRGDTVLKATFLMVVVLLTLQCAGYLFTLDTPPITGAWRNSIWGFFFELTGGGIAIGLTVAILLSISLDVIDKLKLTSNTDSLTGLLNRRGFESAFQQLQEKPNTNSQYFLVLVDLDHFKAVNDTFGHQAGDVVIVRMAELLKEAAAPYGFVGRLGGEEFAVVLKFSNIHTAKAWCEHVRRTFYQIKWEFSPSEANCSASFGLTHFAAADSYLQILRNADQLLYCAKNQGRNRVACGVADS